MKTKQGVTKKRPTKMIVAVLAVLLVAVVTVVVMWFMRGDKPTVDTAPLKAPAQAAQVRITANGFEPNYLQVTAGSIVTWVNTDDQNHQVAADPFPVNNSFELGSGSLLVKGASQEFVFTKPGSYTYHDELNPTKFNGKVEVK